MKCVVKVRKLTYLVRKLIMKVRREKRLVRRQPQKVRRGKLIQCNMYIVVQYKKRSGDPPLRFYL